MKRGFVGIGVLAALVLAGCTEEKAETKPVEIDEIELAKEDAGLALDITIPEATGLDEFNQHAVKLGKELEAAVRNSETAYLEESADGTLHADGHMDFAVKFLDEQTASVLIEAYLYEAGMTHGRTYLEPLNYDLRTGAAIELADLFEGDNYVADLSELAKVEIETSEVKDQLTKPFTEIKENQKFYLIPNNLVLVFDPYEITAGVAGPQKIIIAKSDLKNLKDLYK
ncbi:RsiV family protein [Planococcus sp. 1R117A]|uniref:RsiV family protein n=1 Tax=Planococcus sp. 1R117A TaxID=3447020 RepID=UPI003EDC844C